ncbi:kinase-associated protein B [Bacillus ectoiniformans]|uniref:kinase-associated lipoprotein B n=1 Tax=Bacillus ectoiniformans TaxID=1494429 RepID=UPI0019597149|nr:kinase-associated lipoprotein B [Bacillus ectoiniformans]MBM7648504.1 kinase-associated protein B [Bacillus ectoiniformans]
MNTGEIVTAFYKTGKYIGEITAVRPGQYTVRILAVLRHPAQGDLHNPKTADVPFFHERKALAHREQANIPENTVNPYEGDIPDYFESLDTAFHKLKSKLEADDSAFAEKSLDAMQAIQKEYELMYNMTF